MTAPVLPWLVAFFMGIPAPAFQERPRDPASGSAALSGRVVVDDATGAAARGARVALVGADHAVSLATVCDDDGRFAFEQLPAGRYSLSAGKAGFVATAYGATRPGRAGAAIVLGAGQQRRDVVLRITRGAVLTGTVFDSDGRPAPHQYVSALKRAMTEGGATLVPVHTNAANVGFSGAMTDDRGVFRLFELPPGEYLVVVGLAPASTTFTVRRTTAEEVQLARRMLQETSAQASVPSATAVPVGAGVASAGPAGTERYAPVYFPGTTSSSSAIPIVLTAGEERDGIDIHLQMAKTARLEGVVVGVDGRPAENVAVHLVNRAPAVTATLGSTMATMMAGGRFALDGVAPGEYAIEARVLPREYQQTTAPSAGAFASTNVVVDGRAISGLRLQLEPGLTVSGEVRTAGGSLGLRDIPVRVALVPETMVPGSWLSARTTTSQRGMFRFDDVVSGRYRLVAEVADTAQPEAGRPMPAVVSASVAGRDAADELFEVVPGRPVTDAVIVLSDRWSALSGEIQDDGGHAVSDYAVVIFPADATRWHWRSSRIRTARVAGDGSYEFRALSPGEYLVALVTDVEPGEVFDQAFLEALRPASVSVTIGVATKVVQNLRIARKQRTASQLK